MPASFSIAHRATFKLPVTFKLPSGAEAVITFDCLHKKMSEIQGAEKALAERCLGYTGDNYQREQAEAQAEFVATVTTGWDAVEEFNTANIADAVDLHPLLYVAFTSALRDAMVGAREKS